MLSDSQTVPVRWTKSERQEIQQGTDHQSTCTAALENESDCYQLTSKRRFVDCFVDWLLTIWNGLQEKVIWQV